MKHKLDQLEGRNIVIEVLRRKKRQVRSIHLDNRAKTDHKINEILRIASKRKIVVTRIHRQQLDKMSVTGVHNGVIATADRLRDWSTKELLDSIYRKDEFPLLLMADELNYEHNLGAILRSSMGAGVHGVIVPHVRGKGLTPVVQRVSMGGSEEVPVIREGLSSSLKYIRNEGITVIGADMGGKPIWDLNLKGAVCFVFGGESKGLSPTLRKKCHHIASVPLASNLDSLNVSVAAGVFLFEKVRQEMAK
jgi:23S rRNA (guanosine2251-2'-O)-methyltransferase